MSLKEKIERQSFSFETEDGIKKNKSIFLKDLFQIPEIRDAMAPSSGLANWAERNGWTYNFCDGLWWQRQESHNYIKLTTDELANLCQSEKTNYEKKY